MGQGRSRLDTFVAPRPNRVLIAAMAPVNRIVMLRGLPLLRDIYPFNRIPGFRGVANVRHIDFPAADRARLAAVNGPGMATFIAPNHPEFFTDWMIDKEVQSIVAPLCASWATNGVVNGLGALAQRFWLANNLIAQIPGNSAAARAHSVAWAVAGNGVLLHPEGAVGWHGDWVAPLMPGAAEMAIEAFVILEERTGAAAFVAPIVWKLAFLGDVETRLHAECAYVEHKLKIDGGASGATPAARVYRIYEALLGRDEAGTGITPLANVGFAERLRAVEAARTQRLAQHLPPDTGDDSVRHARHWLREHGHSEDRSRVKTVRAEMEAIHRLRRLGPYAWARSTMTQEQVAEHIKRIRTDYCKGTWRDTLNAFVPQPAGPRTAHIRVAEPLDIGEFARDADAVTGEVRRRLQAALDALNGELAAEGRVRTYPNPFYPA